MNRTQHIIPGMAGLQPGIPFWAKSERLEYVMPMTELVDFTEINDPLRRTESLNSYGRNRLLG